MRPKDVAWIATFVFPLLVRGGVRRFACLTATDLPAQAAIGTAQASAGRQRAFEQRLLADLEQARAWACG